MRKISFVLLAIIVLIGCKRPTADTPEAPMVVKGYLFGGEPIKDIYLEHVVTSRDFDNQLNIPIENAEISIWLGDIEIELFPNSHPDSIGYYQNPDHIVELNQSYELKIDVEGREMSASCFVPDTLTFVTKNVSQTAELGGEGSTDPVVSFSWLPQDGFEYLIDLSVLEEGDELTELTFSDDLGKFNDFYLLPIKETSAQLFDDYFSFTGRHAITIFSISPEYSDYVRYLPTAFERSIYQAPNNISGGFGVFAGLTGTTFEIILEEAE